MKYGQKTPQIYNKCMAAAKQNPIFSKNRRYVKAVCRQKDFEGNARGMKAHIGMCNKDKNPENCKKRMLKNIAGFMVMAKKYAEKANKLKSKLNK